MAEQNPTVPDDIPTLPADTPQPKLHGSAASPAVLAIVGPTAVGKTKVAVRVAQVVSGEVVSLDSRQMYRRLDIGTAKPSADERLAARHHLVDVAEPGQTLTLADVQSMAYAAIDDIVERSRQPILAGGSGQYVRAVLEGWTVPRVVPDAARRAEMVAQAEANGHEWLHDRLALVDPVSAGRIDSRNVRRVVRALEVYEATGVPISELQSRRSPRFQSVVVGLTRTRERLYERIDRRIDLMLEDGLEDEVRRLVADGLSFDLPAMSGVGYGEWRGYLAGEYERSEAVRLIRHNTRRLVRSQMTWFRLDDRSMSWYDLDTSPPDEVVGEILDRLARLTGRRYEQPSGQPVD